MGMQPESVENKVDGMEELYSTVNKINNTAISGISESTHASITSKYPLNSQISHSRKDEPISAAAFHPDALPVMPTNVSMRACELLDCILEQYPRRTDMVEPCLNLLCSYRIDDFVTRMMLLVEFKTFTTDPLAIKEKMRMLRPVLKN